MIMYITTGIAIALAAVFYAKTKAIEKSKVRIPVRVKEQKRR
jgi:hypothetical protein